jgi:hypothetical protein
MTERHVFMLELERWLGLPIYYYASIHGVFSSYDAAAEYAGRFWNCFCKEKSRIRKNMTWAISEIPIQTSGRREPRTETFRLWRWNPEGKCENQNFIQIKRAYHNAPAIWHEERKYSRRYSRAQRLWFSIP